jgi:hypothetical protein
MPLATRSARSRAYGTNIIPALDRCQGVRRAWMQAAAVCATDGRLGCSTVAATVSTVKGEMGATGSQASSARATFTPWPSAIVT